MKTKKIYKILLFGTILLFLGASISTGKNTQKINTDIELSELILEEKSIILEKESLLSSGIQKQTSIIATKDITNKKKFSYKNKWTWYF